METFNVVVLLEGIAMMERQFGAFSEPGNGELWRSTDLFNCTVHVRNLEHERINYAIWDTK